MLSKLRSTGESRRKKQHIFGKLFCIFITIERNIKSIHNLNKDIIQLKVNLKIISTNFVLSIGF